MEATNDTRLTAPEPGVGLQRRVTRPRGRGRTAWYLRRLHEADDWLTVADVDRIDSATCSDYLHRLVRQGHVERKPRTDKPKHYLYRITRAGRQRIKAV